MDNHDHPISAIFVVAHSPGMITPESALEVVNKTGKRIFASEDYGV